MNTGQLKRPKDLVKQIRKPKEEISTLNLPSISFLGIRMNGNSFDAVELDHQRCVYVYKNVKEPVLKWLKSFEKENKKRFFAVGLSNRHKHTELANELWLGLDIIPMVFNQPTHTSTNELIQTAMLTNFLFSPDLSIHPLIYDHNRVIPTYLVNKDAFENTVSKQEWQRLVKLTKELKGKKIRFFSATPQGGGVAIMRHAMIRLLRILEMDVTWHVLYDDPDIFKITKTKFHNILQGVAPKDAILTDKEMNAFREWSAFNAKQFRDKFIDSDVIVIDDPQPAGLVPHIKKVNPKEKLIYRSHIQIESHLVDKKGTPQNRTWNFIHEFIKPAEVMLFHPIDKFVPKMVDKKKVNYMPPTTDPLDGLNKDLTDEQMDFHLNYFNKFLIEDQQKPLDLDRPYLIQIARFDPSKGWPDYLEMYRLLCKKLDPKDRPQLVLAGHGSIDDPDGIPILNFVKDLVEKDKFKELKDDIKIARLPHIDQPLNALLRKAKVALQLSHREGFEFKVTEALMKGIPTVAYKAGGIPLQIKDGVDGYLVEVGDVTKVTEKVYQLLTDTGLYQDMQKKAAEGDYTQFQTVRNTVRWLYLANELLKGNEKDLGHNMHVDELMGIG